MSDPFAVVFDVPVVVAELDDVEFELGIIANDDPSLGPVAIGATGGRATDADFGHVRRWMLGMLISMSDQLPPGWRIELKVLNGLDDTEFRGRPDRPSVPQPVHDRHAAVEEAVCSTCGSKLRREGPDAVWYHVPACADPTPDEPKALPA